MTSFQRNPKPKRQQAESDLPATTAGKDGAVQADEVQWDPGEARLKETTGGEFRVYGLVSRVGTPPPPPPPPWYPPW